MAVQVCTAMGCAAGLSIAPLTGAELRRVAIPGSLTLAWRLGQAVLQAQRAKTDAVAAVVQAGHGILLFTGTPSPVEAGHQGHKSGKHTSLTCCIRVKTYAQVLREQL